MSWGHVQGLGDRMSGRSSVIGRRWTVRTAVLVTLALLSGCWLQQGGNGGHTRYNAGESGLTPATVGTLGVAWTAPVPGVLGEAIVSGGRVFVQNNPSQTHVATTALDAASGDELWSTSLMDVTSGLDALAVSGRVSILDGRVATGHLATAFTRTGQVCVSMPDFLDPATGAGSSGVGNLGFPSARALSGGVVATTLVPYGTDCVLREAQLQVTGSIGGSAIQWRFVVPGNATTVRPPIIAGDLVLVTQGGTLYAFPVAGCGGPSDCPPIWTAPYGAEPAGKATGPIWLVQGTSVLGLDRATGQPAVELPLAGTAQGFAVDGATVYASSVQPGGSVGIEAFRDTCSGSSCTPTWRATVTGAGIGQPIVGGGVVYATVSDGGQTRLLAFDAAGCGAATCDPIASVPLPSGGSLSLGNGRVYVTGAGAVTAVAPAT
jgi:outer membrane protein assembly factor BamB